jgi:hypothetical protein
MTRSMMRWTLVGCMAMAAMGAAAVLDVGARAAEAAPSVSRFAGTYVGVDPGSAYYSWTVAISKSGRIAGSFGEGGDRWKGSMSGEVGADGRYSLTAIVTMASYDDGPRDPRVPRSKSTYVSTGSMELDADRNIDGTADTGQTFIWLRQ